MKYTVSPPAVFRAVYPKRLWRIPTVEKVLYLTFDDGPIPEVTPWVLEQLKAFNAKATFFCIGDNVAKHPEVFQQVLSEGHRVGNHTQHHIKGWRSTLEAYLKEVRLCQLQMLQHHSDSDSQLFRPPYGQIKSRQSKKLRDSGYQVVMWDVLSADFDTSLDAKTCAKNVIEHAKPGSVIVFHDSIKAWPRLEASLPAVLKYFSEKGYEFKCIP